MSKLFKFFSADLPVSTFLPSDAQIERLKDRMCFLVERMLAQQLTCFEDVPVVQHIPHAFSKESCQQSQAVNLCVIKENPSSTAGVTKIMRVLQKYCPRKQSALTRIACHGDGLSVERMLDSQKHNACAESPFDRLEGLLPVPQDFHRRLLLLQDTFNELFKNASIRSRGTLAQLKADFNRKNVSCSVKDCYNHAWEFVQFVTTSYCVLLAMEKLGMETSDALPDTYPLNGSMEQKKMYLAKVARAVVDQVFPQVRGVQNLLKKEELLKTLEPCCDDEGKII